MTRYIFDLMEHEEFGGFGWQMRGSGFMEPLGGLAVAHDCLEHFKGDSGGIHEEFMAFGAMLYIRGEGGYWQLKGDYRGAGEHMSGDLGGLLFDFFMDEAGKFVEKAPRTNKIDEHLEDEISLAIKEARAELLSHREEDRESVDSFLKDFRAWVRIGYRKACKRYQAAICPEELSYMFSDIEKQADDMLNEGCVAMRVDVNISQRAVTVKPLYEWDE